MRTSVLALATAAGLMIAAQATTAPAAELPKGSEITATPGPVLQQVQYYRPYWRPYRHHHHWYRFYDPWWRYSETTQELNRQELARLGVLR
jgi:hypothetical protein